ncbi:hypothetical protein [Enterococcus sp. AZ180]|uniref:hypothetical protein n=1 Tax=Enterococcus sp. AZ180 TaxID=2774961 RepID=UPI003F204CEA
MVTEIQLFLNKAKGKPVVSLYGKEHYLPLTNVARARILDNLVIEYLMKKYDTKSIAHLCLTMEFKDKAFNVHYAAKYAANEMINECADLLDLDTLFNNNKKYLKDVRFRVLNMCEYLGYEDLSSRSDYKYNVGLA